MSFDIPSNRIYSVREEFSMGNIEICVDCRVHQALPGKPHCAACDSHVGSPPTSSNLSVTDEMMDTLVTEASIPNLGALLRKGKDQGLIKAKQGYTST